MPTLDEYIAESARYEKRGYHDPDLWSRLEKPVHEQILKAIREVLSAGVPDYPTYRERVGYVRGLYWVMAEAERLQRIEAPHNERES
jgi:hypothetical protein